MQQVKSVTRRDFMKLFGTGVLFGSLANFGCSARKRKPNIIYILADDLGYGDLSWYGQQKFATPNIDKLANEGITFTDHYAGSTVCAPSRCSLMTGLHTGHCTIRGNWSAENGERVPLKPDDITVAEVLKQAGYQTGVIGKWGLGEDGTSGTPNRKGFDHWFGYLNQHHAHFYYPEYLWRNGEKVQLDGNLNGARNQYSHDLFTNEALNFIERNEQQPFFLYLAYTIPHAELLIPDDDLNKFKGKWPETPHLQLHEDSYNSQTHPRAAFAAMITRMDRDVGKIMDLLKKMNLDEDTIVFFTSDNGPHDEGGGDPVFFNSSGELRGMKRDLYEGGIRIPMIARWPGKIAPGSETQHPSAFWDFLPTATDLAGIDAPENIDGISMLPVLLGRQQKSHEFLYWEFTFKGVTRQAVRMGDWKAMRKNPDAELELYDLKTDPSEKHNVAKKHRDIVEKISEYLKTARTDSPDFPILNESKKNKKN